MTAEAGPPLCNGRYRLYQELGSGGAATVYLAFDAMLGVWRAVKLLSPSMAGKAKVRERFLNEARTMARLKHPHIVTVYDVGVDSDGERVYMVMETLEGGSVMDRVKHSGPLPARMASATVQALLAGLGEAHAHGVVHRDVKPHNVLASKEGVPKLIDFGIAQNADRSLTKTGAVIGTWAYMAPEQRTNAKGVDPRSDIYSAGAVLYAVMTGKDPFDLYATDLHAKLFAGLPDPLVEVIKGATAYEPDERYDNAAEMFHALQAAHRQLPPDPGDTPPLTISGTKLPPPPDTSDFDPMEPVTSTPAPAEPKRRNPSQVATVHEAMNSEDSPSEATTRVVDGVSLHDGIDFSPLTADPSEGSVDLQEPVEFDDGGQGLERMVLYVAVLVLIGLGVGIGAAVMMEQQDGEGDGIDAVAPPDESDDSPEVESTVVPETPSEALDPSDDPEAQDSDSDLDSEPNEPDADEAPVEPSEDAAEPPPQAEPEPAAPAPWTAGTVRVECRGREGDELKVDGVKVGTVPLEIYLEAGDHGFRIEGSGEPVYQLLSVQAGGTLDLCR